MIIQWGPTHYSNLWCRSTIRLHTSCQAGRILLIFPALIINVDSKGMMQHFHSCYKIRGCQQVISPDSNTSISLKVLDVAVICLLYHDLFSFLNLEVKISHKQHLDIWRSTKLHVRAYPYYKVKNDIGLKAYKMVWLNSQSVSTHGLVIGSLGRLRSCPEMCSALQV